MADEPNTDTPADDTPNDDTGTAVATPPGEEGPVKLAQQVEIKDVGPCKKHIKVTVERPGIGSPS